MIKISVIVPAYNCADTLKNTIDSIHASGISDYEIVIIDDGSNDGTGRVCDELAEEHECVHCFRQENAGVSAARNRGIREASGEYVWFFDADDTVGEDTICQIEGVLDADAPDMIVFGMTFDYYYKGKVYRIDEMLPPIEGLLQAAECSRIMYDLYASNSLSSLCNRMVRRKIIGQLDEWLREDMFLYEDLEFTLRIMKQCSSVYFLREPVYRYRQSEDGGNAGRRLMRIPHIPELLSRIEEALAGEEDKDRILLSLYTTLAAERIRASAADLETVCSDYKSWIDDHGLLSKIAQKEYPMLLYNGEVTRLIAKRRYSRIRHSVANWIKQNVGDFRKW